MLRLLLCTALFSLSTACYHEYADRIGSESDSLPSDSQRSVSDLGDGGLGSRSRNYVDLDGRSKSAAPHDLHIRDYEPPQTSRNRGDGGTDNYDTYNYGNGPDGTYDEEEPLQRRTTMHPKPPPTTMDPSQGFNLECFSFTCQFENDEPNCGFSDNTLPIRGNIPFIPGYMAAYLVPGASAVLHSRGNVSMAADRIVRLRYYEAVEGHKFSACCGTESNCPFSSDEGVAVYSWRQWQTAEFVCPKGTDKIVLKCEGKGKHQGACGVDNIDIVDESGESLCYEKANLESEPLVRKLRSRSRF